MTEVIYQDDSVAVFAKDERYFIRYDAGAHQVEIREDEITQEQAKSIAADPANIEPILWQLQRRLQDTGVNPYKSNVGA